MLATLVALRVQAQATDTVRVAYSAARCPSCAQWNAPHAPVHLYGNTYYVGVDGLSSILITSPQGHILIDGALAMSAPQIAANIRALGFRVEDVKLILNSHDHSDHAGGLSRAGAAVACARVAASAKSAPVLERGESDASDPQFGIALPYPPVHVDEIVADGETLRVGSLAITAHLTPGHTPGGTSWSWRSCDVAGTRCLDVVYADSQTPVSADGFLYTKSTTYPTGIQDFEHGLDVLSRLPHVTSCSRRIRARRTCGSGWRRGTGAIAQRSSIARRSPSSSRRHERRCKSAWNRSAAEASLACSAAPSVRYTGHRSGLRATVIRHTSAARSLTADEFMMLTDLPDGKAELVRGEVHLMPPGWARHGIVGGNACARLGEYVRPHRLGQLFWAAADFALVQLPRTVRSPDVAFARARQSLAAGRRRPRLLETRPRLRGRGSIAERHRRVARGEARRLSAEWRRLVVGGRAGSSRRDGRGPRCRETVGRG